MPRIIIPPLSTSATLFETELTIQIGDINYGNHLANDAVLRLCHEVRLRWLATHHWTELNAGGAGLIMADAAIKFTAQGHHGDHLIARLGAPEISRSGFMLQYDFIRHHDQTPIARAQTGMVCFDYNTQKPIPLPTSLHKILTTDTAPNDAV